MISKENFNASLRGVRLIGVTVLCWLVLLAHPCFGLGDELFAPWARLIREGDSQSQQQKIPTKAEVGIPAYPNAYIISLDTIKDKNTGKTMHIIHLISQDTREAVVAFYKERLLKMAGWKWDEIFEAFHTGEDYTEAMNQLKPYMEIMEVSLNAEDMKDVDPALKKTLKSRIQIVYGPKN